MLWLGIAIGVLLAIWLGAFVVVWREWRSVRDEDEYYERGEWWE